MLKTSLWIDRILKTPIIGGIIVLILTFLIGFGLSINTFSFANQSMNFESGILVVFALCLSVFAGILLIAVGRSIKKT